MTLLRIGAWITGALAVLTGGILVVGFLLPSTWEAEAETRFDAPVDVVMEQMRGADGWLRWTPAPESGVERYGPEAGAGSGYRWDDPVYGKGDFVIRSVDPSGIVSYRVEVEGGSIVIDGRVTLLDEDGGTRVVWREEGDFGRNPILGYMASRMTTLQSEQLEQSLQTLRRLVEEERDAAVSFDRRD